MWVLGGKECRSGGGRRRRPRRSALGVATLALHFVGTSTLQPRGPAARGEQRRTPTAAAAALELELKPRARSIDVYRTQPVDIRLWEEAAAPAHLVRHVIHLESGPPIADPFALVKEELTPFGENIKLLVQSENPVLDSAAAHFFEKRHGKRFRPTIVALLSRAVPLATHVGGPSNMREVATERQARLGQITEMIHVASLIHDDVLDDADTRRGGEAIHKMFSNKVAVLVGDYLLARASVLLAKLQNTEVVEVMARALDSLVSGEIMQIKSTNAQRKKQGDGDETAKTVNMLTGGIASSVTNTPFGGGAAALYARAREALNLGNRASSSLKRERDLLARETREMELYLRKSYYKTASLICDASRSCALLAGHAYDSKVAAAAEEYGYHLGLAFQIVDDVLDFAVSSDDLGKPAGADLELGLATAPILYAARDFPNDLRPMIDRRFKGEGDVQKAVDLVHASHGMDLARKLAQWHAQCAVDAIQVLPRSEARDALVSLCYIVLTRSS